MSQATDSLITVSINHETVPLEIRERFAVDARGVEKLYDSIKSAANVSEALVLNTCNRFELYAKGNRERVEKSILETLAFFHSTKTEYLAQYAKINRGKDSIQHLIEVSAGLRSQITGEAEIFGQVKDAYSFCQARGFAGKTLNRVFQKGFQAAKFIRHSTSVGEGQINIANVAVELSAKIFGSLGKASVLSLGTGEIGEKTVKALRSRGTRRFGIASRSLERAEEVAKDWGGLPHTLSDLESYLPNYDIVIASTASEEPVITSELVLADRKKRKDRPLFLIDLGLPRNVDKACGEIDSIFLYNLDDLAQIAEENLNERKKAITESREIAVQKSAQIWDSIVKRGLVCD